MNDYGERVQRLERGYAELREAVSKLEATVHTIKTEQVFLRDLMDARLKLIEKSQELGAAKLDALSTSIYNMGADPINTPSGRALQLQLTEMKGELVAHDKQINGFGEWKSEFLGGFTVVRWLGVAGLAGLILTLLRMIRLIP